MFDPNFEIARLKPADYNPRAITPSAIEDLKSSISEIGMLKPVIATASGRIVAGHQRTRSMRALGMATTPAQIIAEVSGHDEVRFNQLHNAADLELCTAHVEIPAGLPVGWHVIEPGRIVTRTAPQGAAAQQTEIARLLMQHGPWGAAVGTTSGLVIVSAIYAHACRLLRIPLDVRIVPEDLVPRIRYHFSKCYGAFSYAHLPKTTWVQSLAQMNRLRGQTRGGRSRLYERVVLPILAKHPDWAVFDFGSGHGDYAKRLRAEGRSVLDVEFYRRRPGSMEVDTDQVHSDIDSLCRHLRERGRFDLVLADSVLNSTDSLQAEADVLASLRALVKPGGVIAFSGRSREYENQRQNATFITNTKKRYAQFVDADGYTAMFQRGVWLYQRFHTRAQAEQLGRDFIGSEIHYTRSTSSWQVWGPATSKLSTAQTRTSLAREFDLPLPAGSYGRAEDVIEALEPG